MPPQTAQYSVREVLLAEIQSQAPKTQIDQNLQQNSVLHAVRKKLRHSVPDKAILTEWSELFRTGLIAWGYNLMNPNPPFLHVTDRGEQALVHMSRDPNNPAGYLRHLDGIAKIPAIAHSYLTEGLDCYVDGRFKAAAVMVGCAAESLILTLRDATTAKLSAVAKPIPNGLDSWMIKKVSDGLLKFFQGHAQEFSRDLKERFEANWAAFGQQIRAVRNDAGHPSSIDPVTPDTVHASLLIFPELAELNTDLTVWVNESLA